jgi:hypothetical protein
MKKFLLVVGILSTSSTLFGDDFINYSKNMGLVLDGVVLETTSLDMVRAQFGPQALRKENEGIESEVLTLVCYQTEDSSAEIRLISNSAGGNNVNRVDMRSLLPPNNIISSCPKAKISRAFLNGFGIGLTRAEAVEALKSLKPKYDYPNALAYQYGPLVIKFSLDRSGKVALLSVSQVSID